MSHSGNSSSRRLRALQQSLNKEGEQLYNPSIFRYKCVGYLQLNSEHKGSPGICHGYQSRIERVANMVPDTREAAIKKFLDAASDMGTYVDSDDDTSDQKVKEIYTSRTMIYKETPLDSSIDKDSRAKIIMSPKSTSLPEDELINKTEWSCWGSTSVHYLMLDPIHQKQAVHDPLLPPVFAEIEQQADAMLNDLKNLDKGKNTSDNNQNNITDNKQVVTKVAATSSRDGRVTAITPENIGLSIRKIDSSVGHFTVTDIGSVRICVETASSLMDDSSSADKQQQQRSVSNATQVPNSGDNKQGQPVVAAKRDEPAKPNPFDWNNFYKFTLKVGKQFEQNVIEIKEAVSDDFPGRTYRFGTKVVNRLHKTTDQTFIFMGKIFDSWWRSM
jgi:hypothetical protein